MRSKIWSCGAAFLLAMSALSGVAAADEIESRGTAFLQALDRQDYGTAWDALHPLYQALGTQEKWRANVERARAEVGASISRELAFREFTRELPYLPPDQYLVLRFVSHFEKRETASEIVVLKNLEGAGWRVAGYSVR